MPLPRRRRSISSASLSAERDLEDAGKSLSLTPRHRGIPHLTHPCRIGDDDGRPPTETNLAALAERTADQPVPIPSQLPALTPKNDQPRFTESSIYPYLETNIETVPMEFSQEPMPEERTQRSIALHGEKTPFRHWTVMRRYIKGLVDRRGYQDLVSYSTTVERVEKVGAEWKVTLRKEGRERDYWWVEWFDAVVVASGHYSVPYIPAIPGLEQMEKSRPGSVVHSKHFRGRDMYKGKVSLTRSRGGGVSSE